LSNTVQIEQENMQLASKWHMKFKEAMVYKANYTKRWQEYDEAYAGEYSKGQSLPDYKSNVISNYIFSTVETIRPIMLESNPKFQVMARQPEGLAFTTDVNEAMSYEWDRERMTRKVCAELIPVLVRGTSVFFVPWNAEEKNTKYIPVSAYNIFPDPLATCVEDAEYIIYATYSHVNRLKKLFAEYADKLNGGSVKYSELVYNNDLNARIDNQVLLLEVWCKDYETIEENDGKVKRVKYKYPKGRHIIVAPELGLVLLDQDNPYDDGEHPFVLIKDYDVPGKFWGEGEPSQMLSPQKGMNDLYNAIIDNAKATANSPWVIDKNSGIGQGKITARPGLILRKNPGSEVTRLQPPGMPMYVPNTVETLKYDLQEVSGVFNSLKGNSSTGVYTAQGILALKEAGETRIRLKVKLLEDALGEMCRKGFSRCRQYWKSDKWIQITRADGSYDLKKFITDSLKYDYDIKITAGSTMTVNRGAMLDLMIRLAQTPMPDGQMLVDREAVAEYLPEEVKASLLRRMGNKQQAIEQQVQQFQQMIEQLTQQMQQYMQQNDANDKETLAVVEQMTVAIEKINKQIIQLQNKHVKLEEEKKKEEEQQKIKINSYNEGFADAEKYYSSESEGGADSDSSQPDGQQLPDEILTGLDNMSDDELAIVLQQNPDLMELLNMEQPQ